jgi:hypothetical protein
VAADGGEQNWTLEIRFCTDARMVIPRAEEKQF